MRAGVVCARVEGEGGGVLVGVPQLCERGTDTSGWKPPGAAVVRVDAGETGAVRGLGSAGTDELGVAEPVNDRYPPELAFGIAGGRNCGPVIV